MKKLIPDRQYTGEFREAAVSQVLEGGRSIRQVARSLEMSSSTLGKWVELVPKLRTPRLARSVIHGRSVRSLATYRNRPAVGNALFATCTIPELLSRSQHANGARIEPVSRCRSTSVGAPCCSTQ